MKRVLDWTLLTVLLSVTVLWLGVDASRAQTPFQVESKPRYPWLLPWSDDQAREPWWIAWPVQLTGDDWTATLQVLVDRDEEYNDYRLVSTSVGTAAYAVSHGRRVAEVRIPEEPSEIIGMTPAGRKAPLDSEFLEGVTGGRVAVHDYDPILSDEVVAELESRELLVEYPMAVYAGVLSQPYDRVIVMRDEAGRRVFVLPILLAEEVAGQ